ncbi:hypothetical protein IE53DRAFT_66592 [Violaceomyces palustris]|uniref:Uncharacterized protein n=1 Tax=Violaceomyces palustris TaxID=1673888 RepID=A0ACD0NYY4_9BASI|nr:hypothetical protein IE53DRAFT_66592 [Violaceomyces palustris]
MGPSYRPIPYLPFHNPGWGCVCGLAAHHCDCDCDCDCDLTSIPLALGKALITFRFAAGKKAWKLTQLSFLSCIFFLHSYLFKSGVRSVRSWLIQRKEKLCTSRSCRRREGCYDRRPGWGKALARTKFLLASLLREGGQGVEGEEACRGEGKSARSSAGG